MKYSRTDLLQLKDYHIAFDENLIFTDEIRKQFPRIRKINEINVKGNGDYNPEEQRLYINLKVNGSIVTGCAITREDVTVPIETEDDVIFTFDKRENDVDIIHAEGEYIELLPTIFQMIMLDVPTQVIKPGKIDYPKGDGWQVISEEKYLQLKQNEADPRLAILKDYKPQEQ